MSNRKPLSFIGACMLFLLVACGTGTPLPRTSSHSGAGATPQLASGAGVVQAIDIVPVPQARQVYRISLRMDDGGTQTLLQESIPSLEVGERIHITNGVIERIQKGTP